MDNFNFLKTDNNGVTISIKIVPNASRESILGYTDEYIKIKICAPPIENKANKQLILFLSKFFSIPKTSIEFISGEKSKIKRLLLNGADIKEIVKKISVYDRISA
ncbi:MAG: DUF167 domain-containing protein [Candidatus Gastranaerophilales bacterium]|nr:DUF167 domain-containing protein [Candidatus Gastranaerophilales bacterium]